VLEAAYCQYAAFCLIKSLQIITESLAGNKVRQGFAAEIFVFLNGVVILQAICVLICGVWGCFTWILCGRAWVAGCYNLFFVYGIG